MNTNQGITKLGHVRILSENLSRTIRFANRMGLVVDTVYGDPAKSKTLDISCRKAGPMGNHEPRWTDAQRDLFVSAGL